MRPVDKEVGWYLALQLLSGDDKNKKSIIWCLYHDNEIKEEGVDTDPCVFVDILKRVHANDGFVVWFGLDKKDLFFWLRDNLSEEDYGMWDNLKKCQLHDFENLYVKVDKDCYVDWSLPQLHAQIYPGEDTRRGVVYLIGEVFRWFKSRYNDEELKCCFKIHSTLLRSITPGSLIGARRKVKARARWLQDGNNWDPISIGRELPENIKYIVVDVETHNWDDKDPSRIVEIAWMLFDEKGDQLESRQYLLRPYEYDEISQKATRVHGITTKCARDLGSDAHLVFNEFTNIIKQIPDDGFVIAHNMKHENVIFQTNLNKEERAIWKNAPKCDTWAVSLLKHLPEEAKSKYLQRSYGLKLADLHKEISATRTFGAHSAIVDVHMTWDVFEYFKQHASHEELVWKHIQPVRFHKHLFPTLKRKLPSSHN